MLSKAFQTIMDTRTKAKLTNRNIINLFYSNKLPKVQSLSRTLSHKATPLKETTYTPVSKNKFFSTDYTRLLGIKRVVMKSLQCLLGLRRFTITRAGIALAMDNWVIQNVFSSKFLSLLLNSYSRWEENPPEKRQSSSTVAACSFPWSVDIAGPLAMRKGSGRGNSHSYSRLLRDALLPFKIDQITARFASSFRKLNYKLKTPEGVHFKGLDTAMLNVIVNTNYGIIRLTSLLSLSS